MEDDPAALRPATDDELQWTLSHALRFDGRRRVHDADQIGAKLVSERLIEALRMSGFVVMKKPPMPAHTDPRFRAPTEK